MRTTEFRKVCMIIVSGIVLLSCIYISIKTRDATKRLEIAQTEALLLTYAYASTNYFDVYGTWPHSADDLLTNKSNILFIERTLPRVDASGKPIQYIAFSPGRGKGSVVSLGSGLQVSFSSKGVAEAVNEHRSQ
jgi:hypothetical protein